MHNLKRMSSHVENAANWTSQGPFQPELPHGPEQKHLT